MLQTERHLEVDDYAQNIVDTVRDPLLIVDDALRVKSANRAFYAIFRTSAAETAGRHLTRLSNGCWNVPALITLLTDVAAGNSKFDDCEVTATFPEIGPRVMLVNARRLRQPMVHKTLVVIGIQDITARRKAEDETAEASDQDRRIAAALQRSLLFQPAGDAFPGLAVSLAYDIGSDEAIVGGDFWDTFAFGTSSVAFVLGDVMGKGLRAAVFTSELKYTIRAFLHEHGRPELALQHANAHVGEIHRLYHEGLNAQGDDAPVCVLLAVIDRQSGRGSVCTAGMESLLHVRASGDSTPIHSVGIPLGVEPETLYIPAEFELAPGETALMATDGIVDARLGSNFLGTDGLAALVKMSSGLSTLKRTAGYILDAARSFSGGRLHDDACVLLARKL